ncbi:MAG: CapA family protein, partial [Myxococcales bacterium]|nr:CapA family protein [Myxococcales bacterium]
LGLLAAVLAAACEPAPAEPAPASPPSAEPAPPSPPSAEPAASTSARAPAPEAPPAPFTVGFVGDVCLSLLVAHHLDALRGGETPEGIARDYPFTHVGEELRAVDLLVGNLECVASLAGEVDTWHNPFRCAAAPEVMREAGFDLVSVANNHTLDFGRAGFDAMIRRLDEAKLPHFGQENMRGVPQPVTVREVAGRRLGFLAYYVLPNPPLDAVREAKGKVDLLFAFLHWGSEGETAPLLLQRRLARELIDAGVDVVVGTHAHVPQPVEWYQGKVVAYGLGNFVFSGMTHTERHRTGDMLLVDIAPDGGLAHRMARIRLEPDGAPRWVHGPEPIAPPPEGTSAALASLSP